MFQFLVNMVDFKMTPPQAVEEPRYIVRQFAGNSIALSQAMPEAVRKGLEAKGHKVATGWSGTIEVIMRDPKSGALISGLDPTRDSYAAAW